MEAKLVESSAHQPTLLDLLWDRPNEFVKGGGQSTALERFISGYENKYRGGMSSTASTCSLLDSELDDDLSSIENENKNRCIFDVMASNGIITARLADECLCFTGHFSHPDFGELLPVEVSLHTSTRGTWTIQEQIEPISVKFENDRLVFFEKDGPTQFEGTIDAERGMFKGVVIQEGVRGGYFRLQACHMFPRVKAGTRRNMTNHSVVKIVAIHEDGNHHKVVTLPRDGLATIGDVKQALAKLFGSLIIGETVAVVRSNTQFATLRDTDHLNDSREVLLMGLPLPMSS